MILMVILQKTRKKARGRKDEVIECLRNLEDMNLMAIPFQVNQCKEERVRWVFEM